MCKVDGCNESHSKHFCTLCKKDDVTHFAMNCPEGIDLWHGTRMTNLSDISLNKELKASLAKFFNLLTRKLLLLFQDTEEKALVFLSYAAVFILERKRRLVLQVARPGMSSTTRLVEYTHPGLVCHHLRNTAWVIKLDIE